MNIDIFSGNLETDIFDDLEPPFEESISESTKVRRKKQRTKCAAQNQEGKGL